MIKKEIQELLDKAKETNAFVILSKMITDEIWTEIFKLTNLKKLYISNGKIKEIPKEIGKLINLQNLTLHYNNIVEIPEEIGNLLKLEILDFSFNRIKEIPKEIGNLSKIEVLSFGYNKIKELPKEIGNFKKLEWISFSNNPVAIPNGFEISNFKLFENLKIDNVDKKLNIIIGKNGVGKTSLLQAIAFSLIYEDNMDIDTRTLDRYINKKEKKKYNQKGYKKPYEKPYEKPYSESSEATDKTAKAVLKSNYSENIIKKIEISHEIKNHLVNNHGNFLFAYGSNIFYDKDFDNRELIESLVKGEGENTSIDSLFPDKSYKQYSVKMANPTDVLLELERKKEEDEELENVFDFLKDTLNEFLSIQQVEQFEIVRVTGGYYYQNKETKEVFSLHELSEGYRSNILLVGDILVRILVARYTTSLFDNKTGKINVYGTILIDEFDKHLHPTWQRLFVSKLTEVLPNIQFFLTTHNPVALQSAEGGTAIILKKDENGSAIADVEKIKYGNSLEIINNYFFDGEIFGEQTNEDINKLNELKKLVLINKRKIDLDNFMKQVKELKEKDISEEFSTLINYDILYLQKFIDNVKNK